MQNPDECNNPESNTIILGKYQIQSVLGQGKFGQVCKGMRLKDQELVAIKIESSKEFKILKHEPQMGTIYQMVVKLETTSQLTKSFMT